MNKRGKHKSFSKKIENPIDEYMINLSEKVTPKLHASKIGPNLITTISLILVVPMIYFYQIYNNLIAVLFLILAYLFDNFEHYEEAKYNLDDEFADYYDHTKDFLTFFVIDLFIFVRLYYWTSTATFTTLLVITLALVYLMQVHFLNLQKHLNLTHKTRAKKSLLLRLSKKFPFDKYPRMTLQTSRWFGLGTFVLWNIFLILYSNIATF